ncbi:MAG TPA: NAD(P)-binding domain-containing protein, partial [Devosia sp.]|nr:NAD(P)-binding domain-containing protein [Devosia sp.]
MQIGIIGLGRMGANIARRLMRGGHAPVVYDIDAAARAELGRDGAIAAESLEAVVGQLSAPRAMWVMLPAGKITEGTIAHLASILSAGDIIIDGGNSYYKDDIRRAAELGKSGIHYIDVGTSGGVWGLTRGYCMMIGGPEEQVRLLDPIFRTLAPGRGDIPLTPDREAHDPRAEEGYIHAG